MKPDKKLKIKDISAENRPRERLEKLGPSALSDGELLAIILRSGTVRENVLDLSNRLLGEHNIRSLSQTRVGELKRIFGIGKAKSCQIVACFELGRRLAAYPDNGNHIINSPGDIAKVLIPKMRNLKKEQFRGIYLDSKNRILREEVISLGSLDASLVHPREVFRTAISEAAAKVIIAHNHPSSDPTPSDEDIRLTNQLIEAGKIVNIKVLDHIIIGGSKYISMKDCGHF